MTNLNDKDQGIKQIKQISNPNCQSITFLSKDCFKTDNRGITALFQSEVKYLNLINHNFSKVFDLIQVRFAHDCLI